MIRYSVRRNNATDSHVFIPALSPTARYKPSLKPSKPIVKSHPNLQMGVGVTSGDKAFIGGELLRTGFRLCHSDVWTFLDFFDHRFCKYALILDWFRIFLLFKCLLRFSKAAGGQQECRSEKRHSSEPRPISEV